MAMRRFCISGFTNDRKRAEGSDACTSGFANDMQKGCALSLAGSLRQKGYALSLDAILGVVLFIMLIGVMGSGPFEFREDPYASLELQRNMNDVLDLLDARGLLASMDISEIGNAMQAVMPLQYSWKMEIDEYRYDDGNFLLTASYKFGEWVSDFNNIEHTTGSRLFLTFDGEDVNRYYSANYWAWIGTGEGK